MDLNLFLVQKCFFFWKFNSLCDGRNLFEVFIGDRRGGEGDLIKGIKKEFQLNLG